MIVKYRTWLLAVAAALVATGCGGSNDSSKAATESKATPAAASAEAASGSSKVDPKATHITYEGEDGETALDLLEAAGYDVQLETSDLGSYVTGIGDVESTKTKYWLFYVDGKMPTEGADAYVTSDGDEIEWRYGS